MIQPPFSHAHTDSILWALPFSQLEWELTPPAVKDYITTQNQQIAQFQTQIEQLQTHVETLQGRVDKTSQTSSKPPSSDSPFHKPKRQRKTSSGQRGGQRGHRGKGPTLLSPTEVHLIEPGPCPCGHGTLVSLTPYYTHQVIELPPIEMEVHQQFPLMACESYTTYVGGCLGGPCDDLFGSFQATRTIGRAPDSVRSRFSASFRRSSVLPLVNARLPSSCRHGPSREPT